MLKSQAVYCGQFWSQGSDRNEDMVSQYTLKVVSSEKNYTFSIANFNKPTFQLVCTDLSGPTVDETG